MQFDSGVVGVVGPHIGLYIKTTFSNCFYIELRKLCWKSLSSKPLKLLMYGLEIEKVSCKQVQKGDDFHLGANCQYFSI